MWFMEFCRLPHPGSINLNHNIMETKTLAYRSWDDLVFACRNKAYGAYMIRKAYSRRLILAVGGSTTMIAILLVVPEIVSRFINKPVADGTIICPFPVIELTDVPRIIPREIQPQRRVAPVKTVRTNTTIRVVSHEVEPPQAEEAALSFPSEEGEGDGGNPEGLGSAPAIDIPVVVDNESKIWDFVETPPVYEGGMEGIIKFIKKKMRYPASARRQGIEGTVFVSFVVNGDGSVSHVSVLRGIHMDCDEEAARVISLLPSWKGGKQNGKSVSVRMVLPIKFNLQ
jgi:periplasmic protein TonB